MMEVQDAARRGTCWALQTHRLCTAHQRSGLDLLALGVTKKLANVWYYWEFYMQEYSKLLFFPSFSVMIRSQCNSRALQCVVLLTGCFFLAVDLRSWISGRRQATGTAPCKVVPLHGGLFAPSSGPASLWAQWDRHACPHREKVQHPSPSHHLFPW